MATSSSWSETDPPETDPRLRGTKRRVAHERQVTAARGGDGRTLVIAHQVLNRLAQASFDDVHWGLLIRNHLRVMRTEALWGADSDSALDHRFIVMRTFRIDRQAVRHCIAHEPASFCASCVPLLCIVCSFTNL